MCGFGRLKEGRIPWSNFLKIFMKLNIIWWIPINVLQGIANFLPINLTKLAHISACCWRDLSYNSEISSNIQFFVKSNCLWAHLYRCWEHKSNFMLETRVDICMSSMKMGYKWKKSKYFQVLLKIWFIIISILTRIPVWKINWIKL